MKDRKTIIEILISFLFYFFIFGIYSIFFVFNILLPDIHLLYILKL